MARVERRLAATDLIARKINLEPCFAQKDFSIGDSTREDKIPEARRK